MDKLIKSVYNLDLTGNDVKYLTRGKSRVLLYDSITPNDDVIDLIGPTKQVLLLFPTHQGSPDGHWISIIYREETHTIFYWDSYGLSPEAELQYSTNLKVKKNILGNLFKKAQLQGYKFEWNPYRYQKMANGINVCGRFASIRNRFWYLDNEQIKKLFLGQKESPDFIITMMTFLSLNEDESDEQAIITQLGNV